jgi:hypothetical protein
MSSLVHSLRRRTLAVTVLAVAVAAAVLSPATSAHQTIVHAQLTRSGTVVVSGFDGGATLAPPKTP